MNTLHGCLRFALVSSCIHSRGRTVCIFCKPPRQGSANERWSSGGLTSTTGDGARPCHRGPHVCSSSPRPGTAQWGRSPLSWRLGVQLWGQATSGCPGLSTAKPWSTRPLTPPIPISSGQRSGRQHPGGRHSRLFLPGRLASGPMPSPHGRRGLCVGVRGPCGAGLRAGLSWIGPAVPKPQGNRAGQPLRLEASSPSLKPPDAGQESGSVSLHSRELETFQQAPGPLGPLTSGRRLPGGP